jgi:hypothetical protein
MKSIMRKAFEGNPNPVITLDFYAVLRGFMLALMLLSIMDEQFFIHSLRSLLDMSSHLIFCCFSSFFWSEI